MVRKKLIVIAADSFYVIQPFPRQEEHSLV